MYNRTVNTTRLINEIILKLNKCTSRYTDADFKISLFVLIHIKVILPCYFCILNPKNSGVILL